MGQAVYLEYQSKSLVSLKRKKVIKVKALSHTLISLIKVIVVSIYIFCFVKKKSNKKGINFMKFCNILEQISFRIGFSD